MTPTEFAEAIFRMHEILQDIDLVGSKVGLCEGKCKGLAEDNYFNLCSECYEALMEKLRTLEGTNIGKEFDMLLDQLKEALQNDNGELKVILLLTSQGLRTVQ